ncbi:unnamed protein product [marine sediment metagenome]|uniref:Uncharacterized protein n=1 Tax=marine sediment metagenome TaxID=412755 RepID=X1MM11_9ZZZZ
MATTIISNGSKWAGEKPDNLKVLFARLKKYQLDKTYEPFIVVSKYKAGFVEFAGNFMGISHVFNIFTDKPQTIKRLTKAINANRQRKDYGDYGN